MKQKPRPYVAGRSKILFTLIVLVASIYSCASTAKQSSQVLEKPHSPLGTNVVIKNGLALSLPETFSCVSITEKGSNIAGFLLHTADGSVDGLVEYVQLHSADKSKTFSTLLSDMEKQAKSEKLTYSWQEYSDSAQSQNGQILHYRVLEQANSSGLSAVAIIMSREDASGMVQPLYQNTDLIVIQLKNKTLASADFADIARQVFAGTQYAGNSAGRRSLPNGIVFQATGRQWQWSSDLDNGLYLQYTDDKPSTYMGLALRSSFTELASPELPDPVLLASGSRPFQIGLDSVLLTYQIFSFPSDIPDSNSTQYVLALLGSFIRENQHYQLYARNDIPFDPQISIKDQDTMLWYINASRGGIGDTLAFMLELDSTVE